MADDGGAAPSVKGAAPPSLCLLVAGWLAVLSHPFLQSLKLGAEGVRQ